MEDETQNDQVLQCIDNKANNFLNVSLKLQEEIQNAFC